MEGGGEGRAEEEEEGREETRVVCVHACVRACIRVGVGLDIPIGSCWLPDASPLRQARQAFISANKNMVAHVSLGQRESGNEKS